MIVITEKEVYSDNGKYVHRIGTDVYFRRCTKLKTDTEDNFEEVDSIPKPQPEDAMNYGEEVNSLIRARYSLSEELAILRQRDNKPEEYQAYYEYCEECKQQIKQKMSL